MNVTGTNDFGEVVFCSWFTDNKLHEAQFPFASVEHCAPTQPTSTMPTERASRMVVANLIFMSFFVFGIASPFIFGFNFGPGTSIISGLVGAFIGYHISRRIGPLDPDEKPQ